MSTLQIWKPEWPINFPKEPQSHWQSEKMQIKNNEAQVVFQKCKASQALIIGRKMNLRILLVLEAVGAATLESNLEFSPSRPLSNKC